MGRKAHISGAKFSEFIESVPENAVADGYWKIKKENINKTSGGVIQSIMGYMSFDDSEGYDQLRERILTQFAEKHGPAVYYAVPCDDRKKEVPNQALVKFEFKEGEVDMPEKDAGMSPIDSMKHMKRMQKDQLDMQSLEMQRKWMEKMMGGSDSEEEVSVPEGNSMSDMMMWKMLSEGDNKKDSKTDHLLERMAERQADSDRRVESMVEKLGNNTQESAVQGMMAMMMKQGEERDRTRQEEERRRFQEAKDDRRRQEDFTRQEKERFERTIIEERHRHDAENQLRREEMKIEEERARRHGVEQQKFQLQLLDIFKSNRENSLDSTTKIVESLTSAGMASMTTAQKAAESIMDIAQRANPPAEKDDGIGAVIRDVGQMAIPLLTNQGAKDAYQAQQTQQTQNQQPSEGRQPSQEEVHAFREGQASMKAQIDAQRNSPKKDSPPEKAASLSATATVIKQVFDNYPVFRPAMFGSLEDNKGADIFIPMLLNLNNSELNWFLGNTGHKDVMEAIKEVSSPKEISLIDSNEEWFKELREAFQQHLEDSIYGPNEEGRTEEEAEDVSKENPVEESSPGKTVSVE